MNDGSRSRPATLNLRGVRGGFSAVSRLLLVLAFVAVSAGANADYQAGLNAYTSGDYQMAMQQWQAVVRQPESEVNPYIYAEAHYAIAKLYWQGQGVARDFYKAREWLEKAAALDHAGAMEKLGYLYTDGISVQQDFKQAFDWHSKAARLGDVDALYNLGIFYLNGWGVEQDFTMAKQYLAAASAQGDRAAEEALQQLFARDEAQVLQEITVTAEPVEVAAGDVSDATPIPEIPAPGPLPKEVEYSDAFVFQTEPWIETRNPEHYTIQVIGLTDIESLKSLVEGHESHAPWAIYTVQRSSGVLYILIQGEYETVEAARAAQASFPFKVSRRDETWIRKFGMIQKAL